MHVHAISLLSIQHFWKEHGSETHGAKADKMEREGTSTVTLTVLRFTRENTMPKLAIYSIKNGNCNREVNLYD